MCHHLKGSDDIGTNLGVSQCLEGQKQSHAAAARRHDRYPRRHSAALFRRTKRSSPVLKRGSTKRMTASGIAPSCLTMSSSVLSVKRAVPTARRSSPVSSARRPTNLRPNAEAAEGREARGTARLLRLASQCAELPAAADSTREGRRYLPGLRLCPRSASAIARHIIRGGAAIAFAAAMRGLQWGDPERMARIVHGRHRLKGRGQGRSA